MDILMSQLEILVKEKSYCRIEIPALYHNTIIQSEGSSVLTWPTSTHQEDLTAT